MREENMRIMVIRVVIWGIRMGMVRLGIFLILETFSMRLWMLLDVERIL